MTYDTAIPSSTALPIALAFGLFATAACGGGSDTGSGPTADTGGAPASLTTTGGASTVGSTGGSNTSGSTGGSNSPSSGTGGSNSGGSATNTCEAGSGVQGGGSDSCPNLAWRCRDVTLGSPPVHLSGSECSTGHTGACCNYTDKCLTNTDGSPNAQSAVEVAIGPCQAGCATNPSAQACVDCVNGNLTSAGKPKLSDGCGTCFTNLITCSFASCLAPCVAGANTPACRQCVFNNCTVGPGKFNECSGTLNTAGLQN